MVYLLKIKCVDSRVNVQHILASTSVPFTLMAVQVPNLALTHTKRITVCQVKLKTPNKYLTTQSSVQYTVQYTVHYVIIRGLYFKIMQYKSLFLHFI
jgi:hypothetical protein